MKYHKVYTVEDIFMQLNAGDMRPISTQVNTRISWFRSLHATQPQPVGSKRSGKPYKNNLDILNNLPEYNGTNARALSVKLAKIDLGDYSDGTCNIFKRLRIDFGYLDLLESRGINGVNQRLGYLFDRLEFCRSFLDVIATTSELNDLTLNAIYLFPHLAYSIEVESKRGNKVNIPLPYPNQEEANTTPIGCSRGSNNWLFDFDCNHNEQRYTPRIGTRLHRALVLSGLRNISNLSGLRFSQEGEELEDDSTIVQWNPLSRYLSFRGFDIHYDEPGKASYTLPKPTDRELESLGFRIRVTPDLEKREPSHLQFIYPNEAELVQLSGDTIIGTWSGPDIIRKIAEIPVYDRVYY